MRTFLYSVGLTCALVALPCVAQESSEVLVGVAVMENYAGRSVPGNVEQDRLVKSINDIKPDKKTHVKVKAVALNASSDSEAMQEAAQKNCQYVVFTRLTELRGQQDPYQRQPGTIETNPNSQWGSQNQAMDEEYRATVSYKLVDGNGSAVAGAPFSIQHAGSEIATVAQIMDRIALAVVSEAKKGTPAMRE